MDQNNLKERQLPMTNPLLTPHDLPPFDAIKPEHVTPAIEQIIQTNLQNIDALVKTPSQPTWENVVLPLEKWEDTLHQAWSPVSHLNAVVNTPELREVYQQCVTKLSDYATQVGQNTALYNAYVHLKESANYHNLSPVQKKVIEDALRDFTLSGVALSPEKRKKFAELSQKLATLQSQFENNVMDATDNWHFDVDNLEALKGLPEQSIILAKKVAQKADRTGWRLTLDFPCYHAVMTYAEDAKLRQKMHEAYFTRASEKGEQKWDNSPLIEQIMATRHEMAQLLGYKNYGERSLVRKMAKTPKQVMDFLQDLALKTKPQAQKEFAQLTAFAQEKYGQEKLNPWDVAYYSEKLRQEKYAISQETLRPYFPVDTVLQGMFEVVKRLYGLVITQKKGISAWHDDVQFFEIYDAHKNLRGMFYLDLFARNQKRGGAWMDDVRGRRRLEDGTLQYPVALLTCNFRASVDGTPSLLTHDEVQTLFHEFGHGLHHMLTQIDYTSVSGINGVPWDAVELPSQFMENWCWQSEALLFISSHYQTKEPLSAALLDKMHQAKNFQSAMGLLRQLEFSIFDFRIHTEFDPAKGARAQEILDQVRAQYSVVPVAPYVRFQHSFSHIFAGGYAAGYYSYLWAEVLSSDAFSKFEEEGIFNAQTGKAFLEKVLEKGGSEEPDVLFRDFRGKDPDITPFLKERGIA